jgi:hypothetical protein
VLTRDIHLYTPRGEEEMRLIGTDPDGWQHVADINEGEDAVDITSVSPTGDAGGAAVVTMSIFIANYTDVRWRLGEKEEGS